MKAEKEAEDLSQEEKTSLFIRYISKMKGSKRTTPLEAPVPLDIIISFLGVLIGITVVVWLANKFDLLVAASFGASAVLVFGIPEAAVSQPRNVILGSAFSAAAGVATVLLFGLTWWSPALGTALAMLIMLLTKTMHPPGGAVALYAVMNQAPCSYIFLPIMAGTVVLVIIGVIVNNLSPNRQYPRYWY